MRRRNPGRGEGKVGCIIWLVVLALAGFVAYKAIPVKLNASQLYDYMDEQAKFAQQTKPDQLKKRILRRAQELNLPVDPKKLTVRKRGGRIQIECQYTVPLEFPGYTYYWEFDEAIDEPIFIW